MTTENPRQCFACWREDTATGSGFHSRSSTRSCARCTPITSALPPSKTASSRCTRAWLSASPAATGYWYERDGPGFRFYRIEQQAA